MIWQKPASFTSWNNTTLTGRAKFHLSRKPAELGPTTPATKRTSNKFEVIHFRFETFLFVFKSATFRVPTTPKSHIRSDNTASTHPWFQTHAFQSHRLR
jgi:hypothetical protein